MLPLFAATIPCLLGLDSTRTYLILPRLLNYVVAIYLIWAYRAERHLAHGLRRNAMFRLRRLVTSPFNRFAGCSGAPFHCVPHGLGGIVAGQRPTPEVPS